MTRGDIAEKLGLPVAAVVGFIHSYADGAHTSIPAPGLGALAAGLGGKDSKLVHDLAKLGVSADDIAVVSKHDTSTNANDPNESELHNTLAHAIGRTDGNPLFVISQKTLTGHAKGGACIFQVNGLTQLFKSGVIPANAALDCVDPKLQRDDHMVWVRKPLRIGGGEDEFGRETAGRPVKAGLAIEKACRALNRWRLTGCTLYVTVEPCPMCAGAIVNSRLDRVVYGCDDPKAGAVRSLFQLVDNDRLNHRTEVTAGVRAEECAALMKDFFRQRRKK